MQGECLSEAKARQQGSAQYATADTRAEPKRGQALRPCRRSWPECQAGGPRCPKRGAAGNNPEADRPEGDWLGGVKPRSDTFVSSEERESAAGSLPLIVMDEPPIIEAIRGNERPSRKRTEILSLPGAAARGSGARRE